MSLDDRLALGDGLSLVAAHRDPHRDEVHLSLTTTDGAEQTVVVTRARDEAPAYRRTRHLHLSYRGQTLLPPVAAWLSALEQRLADTRFEDVAAWVANREVANREVAHREAAHREAAHREAAHREAAHREAPAGPPRTASRAPSARREGPPFSVGLPTEWHRFVARGHRGVGESVRLRHRVVSVRHQEPECLVSPDVYARPYTFLRYPWHRRADAWRPTATPYVAGPHVAGPHVAGPPADEGVRLYATDIDERDVILGGSEKVAAALADAARDPWGEIGLLSFTCTPTVIGDDRAGAMRAWRAVTDRPLLCLQDGRDRPGEPLASLLRETFAKAAATGPERASDALALVGYPSDVLGGELAFLERLGLRLVARLLPDVHLPDCVSFLTARAQVVDDRRYLRPFVDGVFAKLPVPLLRLAPPVGVEATRVWCQAVAATFDRTDAFATAWPVYEAAAVGDWDAVRREACRHRVGFVVASDELEALWSGALFQGTPVFDALAEMGFGVEVLVHAADGDVSPGKRRVERPRGPAEVRVTPFDTPAALEAALKASDARVFYSEHTFDWRLTTCGKAAFSYHDLAPGLAGARSGARRLLALARGSFFADRASHLGGARRWAALRAAVEILR